MNKIKKKRSWIKTSRENKEKFIKELEKTKENVLYLEDKDAQESLCKISKLLIKALNETGIITSFNTREMDDILSKIINYYNEAIKNEDFETIKLCADIIHISVTQYRKELDASEIKRKQTVIQERVQRQKAQLKEIHLSAQKFKIYTEMKEHSEAIEALEKEYIEVKEKLMEQKSEDPIIYYKILSLKEGEAWPNGEEAQEIIENISKISYIKESCEHLKKELESLYQYYKKINLNI